jgi:hypothetical protein
MAACGEQFICAVWWQNVKQLRRLRDHREYFFVHFATPPHFASHIPNNLAAQNDSDWLRIWWK